MSGVLIPAFALAFALPQQSPKTNLELAWRHTITLPEKITSVSVNHETAVIVYEGQRAIVVLSEASSRKIPLDSAIHPLAARSLATGGFELLDSLTSQIVTLDSTGSVLAATDHKIPGKPVTAIWTGSEWIVGSVSGDTLHLSKLKQHSDPVPIRCPVIEQCIGSGYRNLRLAGAGATVVGIADMRTPPLLLISPMTSGIRVLAPDFISVLSTVVSPSPMAPAWRPVVAIPLRSQVLATFVDARNATKALIFLSADGEVIRASEISTTLTFVASDGDRSLAAISTTSSPELLLYRVR